MQSPDCSKKDPVLAMESLNSDDEVLNELVQFFNETVGDKLAEGGYRYTDENVDVILGSDNYEVYNVERNYWVYIVEVILDIDESAVPFQHCQGGDYGTDSSKEDENERANSQAEKLLGEEARNASDQNISSSQPLKKKRKKVKQKANQGKESKSDEVDEQEEEKESDEGKKDEGCENENVDRYEGRRTDVDEEQKVVEGFEGDKSVGYEERGAVGYEGEEERTNGYEGEKVNVPEREKAERYNGERVSAETESRLQDIVSGNSRIVGRENLGIASTSGTWLELDHTHVSILGDLQEEFGKNAHMHLDKKVAGEQYKERESNLFQSTGDDRNKDMSQRKELSQSKENSVSGENVNIGQTIENSDEPKQVMEDTHDSVYRYEENGKQIKEPEEDTGIIISTEVPEVLEREFVQQTMELKQTENSDESVGWIEVQSKKSKRLKRQTEELKQAKEVIVSKGNDFGAQDAETTRHIEEANRVPGVKISKGKVLETQKPTETRNVDEDQDEKRVKQSQTLKQQIVELKQAAEGVSCKGNVSEAQSRKTVRQIEKPWQAPGGIIWREKVQKTLETESVKETQEPSQAANVDEIPDKKRVTNDKTLKEPRTSANSVPVGIRNLGRTCYMNATFQFLLRPMGHKWLDLFKLKAAATNTDTDLIKEFHRLWELLLSNNGGSTIEPESTKRIQRAWNIFEHPSSQNFEPTQQEDAEKFMEFIFTLLMSVRLCNIAFGIEYFKAACCRMCPNTEIIHNHQYLTLRLGIRDNGKGAFDLTELLVNKFQNSVCTEYFCGRCHGTYMGNYNRFISTSEFLIIWLPRTTNLSEVGHWKRQCKLRNIPHELDFKPYFGKDKKIPEDFTKYQLHAVLTHFGQSMDSGHYIAAVLHTSSATWFKFDDDRTTKLVDFQREVGDDAYMLLYRNLAQRRPIERNERSSVERSSNEERGEAGNAGNKDYREEDAHESHITNAAGIAEYMFLLDERLVTIPYTNNQ